MTHLRSLLAAFLVTLLAAPLAALATPAPPFAYIPFTNSPNTGVVIVDVAGGTFVLPPDSMGTSPRWVGINAGGNRVFVGADTTIKVLETTQNSVIATFDISAFGIPDFMTIDDTGARIFLSTHVNGGPALRILDGKTGALLRTVAVAENPGAVVFDPQGHTVYVAHSRVDGGSNPLPGTVDAFDVSVDPPLAGSPITVGKGPTAMAVSHDGTRLYVANGFDLTLSVIDTSTNTVSSTTSTSDADGRTSLAVNPVDGHVFASSFVSNSVDEFDATGANVGVFADVGGNRLTDIAVTPDGSALIAVDGNNYQVRNYPLPLGTGIITTLLTSNFPVAIGRFIGPATILYTPNAPTSIVATQGQGQASVQFGRPASDPSSLPIVSYTVTASDGIHSTTGSASPIVVTGLVDGTSYTFTVVATNANGDGIPSVSDPVTPLALAPSAPTGVTAVAGNAQATVSFTAPAANGAPITSYTVTSSPSGIMASGAASPITVPGLVNGTDYTFTVTATNSAGSSAASSASNHVVPRTVPGAPTNIVATAGDGSVSVAFTPPADNGGAPITSYTVTSTVGGFTATGASSPIVVSGLANGTDYAFTVTASNAAGTGPPSAPSNDAIPCVLPGAPTGVTASVSGVGWVRVECTPPAVTGSSSIAFYHATSSPGGITGDGICPFTVVGLTVGTTYTFTLVAVAQGTGFEGPASAPSNSVTAATVPGVPIGVTATVFSDTAANVIFTPPASDGGSPITLYEVRATPSTGPVLVVLPSSTSTIVTGLTKGTAYTFTVSAVNAAGEGLQSAPSNSVTPVTPPTTDVRAMGGDGRATVSFVRPSVVPASSVTWYVATASPGGLTGNVIPGIGAIHVTGLTNGTSYTFTVTTNHADGSSEISAPSNAVTPAKLPARTSPWAYVPSLIDGFVAVIDTATNRVINTIDVGRAPIAVAANAAGTRVYVANAFDDSVSVIDTASQAVVATIPVPNEPFGIAVDPSGAHVYVTAELASSVTVIDTASNTVSGTITLPVPAAEVEVDPSGASIYASLAGLGQIVRIDAASKSIVATSPVLTIAPFALAAGAGDVLYASDGISGQVATLSGTTLQQQSITAISVPMLGDGIAVDPADGHVYFARGAPFAAGTLNQLGGGAAPAGSGVAGVSVTPTGGQVYIANKDSNDVTVVDGASMTVVATIPVGNSPIAFGRFISRADTNPPRLGNISTRMEVLTGDNVMIAGFIIGGSTPKTVAIVATGPSLVPFGITNPLADPMLTLVRQSDHAVIATNDNWQSDAHAAQLTASTFAPTNALESGLYVTLPPGAYTAIVQGAGGGVGVGVIGVFEIDHLEVPLVNISTRGLVLTGDNVMIAGLIVQGDAPQTVVIAATGPSLVPFGITNPLPDPTLTLVRQSDHAVIATNDNWQSALNAAAITASGFAPTDPHESAIMITLDPGAYTAIVQGAGGGTGVSVVGVFTVP